MTNSVRGFRTIRLVGVAALLTFAGLLCLFIFNAAIQSSPFAPDDPVERWIQAGIDLSRLDELDSMNFFGKGEFEAEYERVLLQSKYIPRDSEFPSTTDGYAVYIDTHFRNFGWSPGFWLVLAVAFIVSVAAFSWMHGVTVATKPGTPGGAEQCAEQGPAMMRDSKS